MSLVARLANEDGAADERGTWPAPLWSILLEAGATRWCLPRSLGGDECDRWQILENYAEVAQGSLTAAFILTQHDAAVRRLLSALDTPAGRHWAEEIAAGRAFTTVGISQLSTSRRHGEAAITAVERSPGAFVLNGVLPWVTGAERADMIVAGAVTEDGRQLLLALPTNRAGVSVQPSFPLAALQASCTSEVLCQSVPIDANDLLAGPTNDVLGTRTGPGPGGLETSALALGQARAAIDSLRAEAPRRPELVEPLEALTDSWDQLWNALRDAAAGSPQAVPSGQIRGEANDLVLSATQAYLTARKGSGFLRSDPAQRWARQALFFLVWSCPSPVAQAAIRGLAGLCPA